MNYWSVFCLILKYLPGSYLVLKMIDPIIRFIEMGNIILPFSYQIILILILLQILSILFIKSIEISEQVITVLTLKGFTYITWGEVKKIERIKSLSPVTYIVRLKKGLPFIFIAPGITVNILFTSKAYGSTIDLIDKIKFERAI